jgi:8-oxo-dGTP pyrophosphatase MutT (NUDIX family)
MSTGCILPVAVPGPSQCQGDAVSGRHRPTARVLLVDADTRVLLFLGGDPIDRAREPWWFTPGGGVEPGESVELAAVRELAEETGLSIAPAELGPVVLQRAFEWTYAGELLWQDEVFFAVRTEQFAVDDAGWTDEERITVEQARWWSAAELRETAERFYPPELPDLLDQLRPGQATKMQKG